MSFRMSGIDYTKQNGNDVFDLVEVFSDHYDETEQKILNASYFGQGLVMHDGSIRQISAHVSDKEEVLVQTITNILERMAELYQHDQRQESLALSYQLIADLDQLQRKNLQ